MKLRATDRCRRAWLWERTAQACFAIAALIGDGACATRPPVAAPGPTRIGEPERVWPATSPALSTTAASGNQPEVVLSRRRPKLLVPAFAGSRSYSGLATGARVPPPIRDHTATAIMAAIVATAVRAGRPKPAIDGRLIGVAHDLAALGDTGQLELRRFLLIHHGVVEPDVGFQLFRLSPRPDAELARAIVESLGTLLTAQDTAVFGAGVGTAGPWVFVALVTIERPILLEPLPKSLPARGSTRVRGRIPAATREPQVVVESPRGRLGPIPLTIGPDGGFDADFRCFDGEGRYQVEVNVNGAEGPMVLANFVLFCGVAPPAGYSLADEAKVEHSTDPATLERGLTDALNGARAKAGLAALESVERLSQIARRHSADMAKEKKVAHHLPETGNAADRVHAAGLQPRVVLENVGSQSALVSSGSSAGPPSVTAPSGTNPEVAPSATEIHQGFMASPGHRANILSPDVTRVGIGVARGSDSHGVPTWYVTQLFVAD